MSSDAIHDQHEMRARVLAVKEKTSQLRASRDHFRESLESTKAEIVHLSKEIDVLTKVEELFRALMDLLVVKQVRVIEEVVTEGFQTIFYDQDLHFEAEIGTKYNKVSIDFLIREGSLDDPIVIRGNPLDNFGGGPVSVASLILRILAIFRLQKYPILLLDETLNAVSEEYIEGTGAWLQKMAASMGVPALLITHKAAYVDHCTRAYRCNQESVSHNQRALRVKQIHRSSSSAVEST